jgi:hypothetical protein
VLAPTIAWLEAALTAIRAILAVVPDGAQILRGAFTGITAQVELQLDDVAHLQAVVDSLDCGLTHRAYEAERGLCTGLLWRRREWTGIVFDTPVLLWAYEMLQEPPPPAQPATVSLATRIIGLFPSRDGQAPVSRDLTSVLAGHRADADPVRTL